MALELAAAAVGAAAAGPVRAPQQAGVRCRLDRQRQQALAC